MSKMSDSAHFYRVKPAMTVIEFLQTRKSIPAKFLNEPAPSHEEIRSMIQAALAAPDHGMLNPWKFIVIEGEARNKLGALLAEASRLREPTLAEEKVAKQREKPLRSPTIIVVVATIVKNHVKVPEIEQVLSAGAAAQQLMLAANSMGYGAIWLTGPNSNEVSVKSGLGVSVNDVIIGFIYLGTSSLKHSKRKFLNPDEYTEHWN